jgi:hypothetical protein
MTLRPDVATPGQRVHPDAAQGRGLRLPPRPAGPRPHPATSEKHAKLAQKLGQIQPFICIAVFTQERMGQPASSGPT